MGRTEDRTGATLQSTHTTFHRPPIPTAEVGEPNRVAREREPDMGHDNFETPAVALFAERDLPLSPVTIHDGFVTVSGQTPRDPQSSSYPKVVSSDFRVQAHQVFGNMRACLEAAGCGFEHVLKVTGFLADWEDFPVFNEVYMEYFAEPLPARSVVAVDLNDILLEVECTARVP
jgi:2-iminobutanoate/2-iminopropanoate deaminase